MEKYKTTKTLRFRLEPVKTNLFESAIETLENDSTGNLTQLIADGFALIKSFEEYAFKDKQKNKLKYEVTIHFRYLRQYTKDKFYEWRTEKTEKKIRISDVPYLKEVLSTYIEEWKQCIERLNEAKSKPEESQTRRADIGLQVKQLGKRQMFPFLRSFIQESNHKDSEELKNRLLDATEAFKNNLLACERDYLPAQSSGFVLSRASFNYYTINKKWKDYNRERQNVKDKLEQNFQYPQSAKPEQRKRLNILNEIGLESFKALPLYKLYDSLKQYKSDQKKAFPEAVTQGLQCQQVKAQFPLFDGSPDVYQEYQRLTQQITELAEKKNKTSVDSLELANLRDELSRKRKERGYLFFDGPGGSRHRFERYLTYCKLFKDVALKRGRLIARLKGIDKEKIDSQRLEYWALILEKEPGHQLVLIPKDSSQNVYQKISNYREAPKPDQPTLYYFESLTYRALKKLCFGVNGNTFLLEIKKELETKRLWGHDERDFGEHVFKTKDGSRDEKALISFYQNVLRTEFVRKNLALPDEVFDEVAEGAFETEQDFRMALEKCCYARHRVLPDSFIQELLQHRNAQLFDITSLDLRKKTGENLKTHTRLWLDFWTSENQQGNFGLRLNPEIAISWRAAKETRIAKYGEGTELYDPSKQNRYLHPQFTLVTTFTENALNNEISYAFEDTRNKGEAIIAFNAKISETLKDKRQQQGGLWFYGIDAGNIELATLCLIGADRKPQRFTAIQLKSNQLEFSKYGYVHKNGAIVRREQPYRAISNLSYFLDEALYEKTFRDGEFSRAYAELFEEKPVCVIDLTTAKVINGKIVLNGDLITFLKLKILHAKRKIYQMLIANTSARIETMYEAADPKDSYKIKVDGAIIYHSKTVFESLRSFQEISDELTGYFHAQQKDEARLEENINNTRRALVGNMTGVISHLYRQYPGVIAIENLGQNKIESDRKQFEGNIERPLEWALYRRFQSEGLTPPVSELIALRETEKFEIRQANQYKQDHIRQFGVIHFVSEEGTSLICPNLECKQKAYPNSDDEKYKADKKKTVFDCRHCGFHNKDNAMGLADLDSNDKIAAYNISQRGFEALTKKMAD